MPEPRLLHNKKEFYYAWCRDSLHLDFGPITRARLEKELGIKFKLFSSTESQVIKAIRANDNLFERAYRLGVDFWGDPGEMDDE